jgi:hypothetical protein
MASDKPALIRAIRGPILLMTLGLLFVADFFGSYRFSKTFPVLLIVFGLLWLLERLPERRHDDSRTGEGGFL